MCVGVYCLWTRIFSLIGLCACMHGNSIEVDSLIPQCRALLEYCLTGNLTPQLCTLETKPQPTFTAYSFTPNNFPIILFSPVSADVNLVWPQVPVMVQLIHMVGSDDEHSDSLVASAAGLLG